MFCNQNMSDQIKVHICSPLYLSIVELLARSPAPSFTRTRPEVIEFEVKLPERPHPPRNRASFPEHTRAPKSLLPGLPPISLRHEYHWAFLKTEEAVWGLRIPDGVPGQENQAEASRGVGRALRGERRGGSCCPLPLSPLVLRFCAGLRPQPCRF